LTPSNIQNAPQQKLTMASIYELAASGRQCGGTTKLENKNSNFAKIKIKWVEL
jgi:hypothetical protein